MKRGLLTFMNLTGNARKDGRWKIDNTTHCGMIQLKVTFAIKRALHQRAHERDTPEGVPFKITCEPSTPIHAWSVWIIPRYAITCGCPLVAVTNGHYVHREREYGALKDRNRNEIHIPC